jgi:hypothetical protein
VATPKRKVTRSKGFAPIASGLARRWNVPLTPGSPIVWARRARDQFLPERSRYRIVALDFGRGAAVVEASDGKMEVVSFDTTTLQIKS